MKTLMRRSQGMIAKTSDGRVLLHHSFADGADVIELTAGDRVHLYHSINVEGDEESVEALVRVFEKSGYRKVRERS